MEPQNQLGSNDHKSWSGKYNLKIQPGGGGDLFSAVFGSFSPERTAPTSCILIFINDNTRWSYLKHVNNLTLILYLIIENTKQACH